MDRQVSKSKNGIAKLLFKNSIYLFYGLFIAFVAAYAVVASAQGITTAIFDITKTSSSKETKVVIPVRIVRVIDGDTVVCELPLKFHVRLKDFNAPELNEKDGADFKHRLAQLTEGKIATLVIDVPDGDLAKTMSFERILGRIYVNGIDVSTELSKQQTKGKPDGQKKVEKECGASGF